MLKKKRFIKSTTIVLKDYLHFVHSWCIHKQKPVLMRKSLWRELHNNPVQTAR